MKQREARYMQDREDSGAIASTANAGATDPWMNVSHDVICRFVDVLMTEHAFSRRTRIAYGVDVQNLDYWMRRTHRRTAIAARAEDLHEFFAEQMAANTPCWLVKRARRSARRFYKFLRECHYRDDDPMAISSMGRACRADAPSKIDLEAAA